MPDFRKYAVEVPQPGKTTGEATRILGAFLRDIVRANPANFRVFGPDETSSNRLGPLFEVTTRRWVADTLPEDADGGYLSPDGRVMEILSEHTCQGWLEGYLLTGRHGLFNSYEAFIHLVDSMFNQHAKWLKVTDSADPLAQADRLPELPAHLARLAAGPQRFQPPGPGVHRPRDEQEGGRDPRVPAPGRQHPAVGGRPLPAQPQLRQRHRGRQAAGPAVPGHGRGGEALRQGHRTSGSGPAPRR